MSRRKRLRPRRADVVAAIARADGPIPSGHARGYSRGKGYGLRAARVVLRRLDDGSKAYRYVLRDLDKRIGSE